MAKSDKHSERRARLIAAFVTLECLVIWIVVARPIREQPRKITIVPVATPQPLLEKSTPVLDPNQEFRIVPGRWTFLDFKHFSYGPYKLPQGRKIDLTLRNGEYEYDFNESGRGWFSLRDVYY